MLSKDETEVRATALDMAIRSSTGGEMASNIAERAGVFLSFLRGSTTQAPKKLAKKR